MLTISTKTKVLYINIDLLKSKLKKATISILQTLSLFIGFCGIILMLCGVGQHEQGLTTFNDLIITLLKGGCLFGIACILNYIKNALQ